MKKLLTAITMTVCLFMSGCGAGSANATVNHFYQSLEKGELSKATGYTGEEFSETLTSSMNAINEVIDEMKKSSDSESAISTMEDLESSIIRKVWQSHQITDTKQDGDKADVTVTVKGISAQDMQNAFAGIDYSSFTVTKQDEAYQEMADFLKTQVTEALDKVEPQESSVTLHLEKKNAGWIITGTEN